MTGIDIYGQISHPMHVTDALMLLMHWCCWCAAAAYAADALMLLMHWCCWCADAVDAADAVDTLMLLISLCCWCAYAADELILLMLMLLMWWCCWCTDAVDALMLLICLCCWSGVSILRYFSRTLLIIYSHFYKKLGPFYKKINCETMVTDHSPVWTIVHLTTTYKALKRHLPACTL